MRRVLVLDEALPFPPDSGKRIRTWELLSRLADDFEITLAYHQEGPVDREAVEAAHDAGITPLAVPRRPLVKKGLRFAWDLGRNVFLPVPYMVMGHRTAQLRAAAVGAHAAAPFDLVHVEWTPLVANLPKTWPTPVCISAHNVESDIWRRYKENEKRFAHRRYIALQHRKVLRFEAKALGEAGAVTAVSEHDATRIRSWAGQRDVTVVPNGVNATYFAPQPDTPVDPDEIVFVGSLDWRPNLDGVHWFLDEVLGPLRARHPRARLSIVGRNPPESLIKRADATAGVTVHGSVPDVRPYVARAAVSAVPLRIGGGSRLKICEALAMQRPVVSTTVGAEGLHLADTVVRADEPEAFAEALADDLKHPDKARERAMRGYKVALETYEWSSIAPIQARVWERLAARPGRGR